MTRKILIVQSETIKSRISNQLSRELGPAFLDTFDIVVNKHTEDDQMYMTDAPNFEMLKLDTPLKVTFQRPYGDDDRMVNLLDKMRRDVMSSYGIRYPMHQIIPNIDMGERPRRYAFIYPIRTNTLSLKTFIKSYL